MLTPRTKCASQASLRCLLTTLKSSLSVNVCLWHIADSLNWLASRPLLGVKQTLPNAFMSTRPNYLQSASLTVAATLRPVWHNGSRLRCVGAKLRANRSRLIPIAY